MASRHRADSPRRPRPPGPAGRRPRARAHVPRFLAFLAILLLSPACGGPGGGSKPALLVVGLDGGTWKLLEPWMERGDLPNLKSLVAEGVSGELTSVVPFLSPPAWASAVTGTNPGKHAIYDFLRRLPDEMTVVNETARSRRVPPIWMLLSDAGFKVGVVNVPATDPPDPVNGFMIAGMPNTGVSGYCWPPELEKELDDYRLDRMEMSLGAGREQEMLDDIFITLRRRAANIEKLLATREWDFAWVVFTASDRVQHFFWQFMDPEWPGYDPARAARYGSAVHDVWKEMDAALGRIVALARQKKGARLPILVMSDHGFGPVHREFRLQSFLRHPPAGQVPINTSYSYETNGSLLYFSLRGREPDGALTPGQFQAERDEAARRIRAARDPETGLAPAQAIYRREEIFRGRYAEKGPDLMMVPTPGVYISNDKGEREPWGPPSYSFSAHHEMDGILVAVGGPFRPGRLGAGAGLLDMTPTLLHLLGRPVPSYCDGRVLTEILDPDYVRKHPVKTEEVPLPGGPTAADTTELPDQMKGLGYIE